MKVPFHTDEWSVPAIRAYAALHQQENRGLSWTPMLRADHSQVAYWDEWHRRHDHACHPAHAAASREEFSRQLFDPVATRRHVLRADPQVLELGCGQGHSALELAEGGSHVLGIDHSSIAIAEAKRALHAKALSERVTFRQADYFDFLRPCPSVSFDGIYSHLALHYFDEPSTRELFSHLGRVVRPGGVLLFTVRAAGDDLEGIGERLAPNVYRRNGHVRHFFTESLVRRLLSDWSDSFVQPYDRTGEVANPGRFILGVARR